MIHKNSSQYWIVKDVKNGVSCISYWQTGLGIVQCCNIVPSFVSSIGESWDSGLYFAPQLPRGFDHLYRAGRGTPPLPTPQGRGGAPLQYLQYIFLRSQDRTCLLLGLSKYSRTQKTSQCRKKMFPSLLEHPGSTPRSSGPLPLGRFEVSEREYWIRGWGRGRAPANSHKY